MLKLKRLKINKFRHVVPTELVFDDRYNVPLGINGSGKTTLLKLISACLRSDFAEYKAEELDVEYELEVDGTRLVVGAKVERGDDSPLQALAEEGHSFRLMSPSMKFALSVAVAIASQSQVTVRAVGGRLSVSVNGGAEEGVPGVPPSPTDGPFLLKLLADTIMLPTSKVGSIAVRQMPWGQLSDGGAARRFDESLDMLWAITGDGRNDPAHPSPIGIVIKRSKEELPTTLIGGTGFMPRHLISVASRSEQTDVQRIGAITLAATDWDSFPHRPGQAPFNFLANFMKATKLHGAELSLRILKEEDSEAASTLLLGGATFRFRTKHGGSISHELLSYGQKRLLSFLYYVACNDACVVADELVNGLHHAWIEVCLDAIGERQAFLTSQNPLLLDFLPPASPEEAKRRFIRCVLEEREGRDVMVWRNLTHDEATEFCEEYAVGVQQVSELLRVQGLW